MMASEEDSSDSKDVVPRVNSDKWAAALERLSAEDQKCFDVTAMSDRSPQDVLSDVLAAANKKKDECMKKRWKVAVKGRTIILRDVLEKITVWVSKFKDIGSSIASLDPIAAGLPWAAVCFILQAGVNDIEVFGFVLQSIESISNILASAAIFEILYLNHTHQELAVSEKLTNGIVALYAAVLQFLAEILHYYSQRTGTRLIKSVGVGKSEFQEKYEPIKAAKAEVWELATLAEAEKTSWTLENIDRIEEAQLQQYQDLSKLFGNLQQPIDRLNAQLDNIEDGLERERRIQILRSISTIPYTTHHKAAKKGRLHGSGQWLLDNHAFRRWRNDSTSSVLWLHGIPGSGKTKLTSLVIDELTGSENMAYFYCARNPAEPLRGKCDAILASLVRQLSGKSANSGILPAVVAPYQDALDGIVGFEDFSWTSDESSSILLELLEDYPAATIVLDALDEVNPEDRQELMDVLSKLLREAPNLLKIFVSSRDNYDITLHFEGSPNIHIDAHDNRGDIESFIDNRLTAAKLLRGWLSDTLRRKIAQTLLEKAQGMFRWVELQIQSLRPLKVEADIEARLGILPASLEESYWEVYQEILSSGDHATELAVFTFQWVMYAEAAVEAHHFAQLASCALSSVDVPQTFTEMEIIDVCANLVVKRSGVLQFAHLSVREFLEALPNRSVDTILVEPSHSRLAKACLSYLSLKQLENPVQETYEWVELFEVHPAPNSGTAEMGSNPDNQGTSSVDKSLEAQEEARLFVAKTDKPLLEYTSQYWPKHASKSGSLRMENPLRNLIREFMVDDKTKTVSNRFRFWCSSIRQGLVGRIDFHSPEYNQLYDASDTPANPIWLACFQGWLDVVEYLYEIGFPGIGDERELTDYRDSLKLKNHTSGGMSTFSYAMEANVPELAKKLLSLPPDQVRVDDNMITHHLELQAERGYDSIVEVLLANAHGGLEAEKTAFVGAARIGQVRACSILLDHNPQLMPSAGEDAFVAAARTGKDTTLSFLLGHNPQLVLVAGERALIAAAGTGKDTMCAFLLDKNPQLISTVGELAFLASCEDGHYITASLLVDRAMSTRGLDVGSDHESESVFSGGTDSAPPDGVAEIIDASPDWKREDGESAVMDLAAVHGNILLMRELLLRRRGTLGMARALITSISHDHDDCAELLQQFGVEKNPLEVHDALIMNKPDLALRLIEHGFPVGGTDAFGTPLHGAAENGYDNVVAAILGASVEVDTCNHQKQTPLHLAAQSGSTECARLLLDHGADVLAEDDQGRIPLDLAEESGKEDCEALIRERMQQLMDELTKKKFSRGGKEAASAAFAESDALPSGSAPVDASDVVPEPALGDDATIVVSTA